MPRDYVRIMAAICASLGISAVGPARGQTVIPATISGQPLIYMKEGNVIGCGVRFVIVDLIPHSVQQPVPVYDVSFNLYSSGHGMVKGGSEDVSYKEIKTGSLRKHSGKPVTLSSLWIKARDKPATVPLKGIATSEDPGMIFYAAGPDAIISLFRAQGKGESVLVGTKRQGAKTERIFSGEIALSDEEQMQLDGCLKELAR